MNEFVCAKCGQTKPVETRIGVGYAIAGETTKTELPHRDKATWIDTVGVTICYDCCAEIDRETMRRDGKHTGLYLRCRHPDGVPLEVVNWPGSLRFKVQHYTVGNHNIGHVQHNVWFEFEGQKWWGRQVGTWNEICRVRRVKG